MQTSANFELIFQSHHDGSTRWLDLRFPTGRLEMKQTAVMMGMTDLANLQQLRILR